MILPIFCLFFIQVAFARFRYDDYHLVEIVPKTNEHLQLVNSWSNNPEFDIWNDIKGVNDGVLVLLSPKDFENYKTLFEQNDIDYNVKAPNIQRYIDDESMSMISTRFQLDIKKKVVAKFARYAEVNQYLDTVASENSEYLSTYIAGQTLQGRDLKVLKFKTANTKRSIWINCGIHAREWITIASCTYAIDKLINQYNAGNAEVVDLLNYYEIHIIPILNPDGYEFTREKRMWRKNRYVVPNSQCIGVDLNRNFPFKWMEAGGASSNPCSDTYAGPTPSSELETQAVIKIIESKQGEWDAFLDIHSFGLWYLLPFGYTNAKPKDYSEMLRAARVSADAISSYNGTEFTIGATADLLYLASGNSIDYAYGQAGIKYSYCLELRPDSNSGFFGIGFLIRESYGVHSGEELYRGFVGLFKETKNSL